MEKSSKYYPIRRSTRLPLEIPLRVTSLDPKVKFAEDCNTVTVNAHGCGLMSPKRLAAVPWAAYCLHCQESRDAQERPDSVQPKLAA